ncbi:MAG: hypothetical protein MJZ30_01205 [Paludibacteraceae bacterium]|nr:hypothetical protein [Paludibacteraceae bacterium]
MKKMIVLSISLLLGVFVYFFLRDREKIIVFSCPDDCEIGCLTGHFVELEFINKLLLPVLYNRTDCFDGAQLKPILSLSDDLNLDAKSSLGSWRMDSCIVRYNKFGFIDDIYILGNKGYYFHSVYQKVSAETKRKLNVMDLMK